MTKNDNEMTRNSKIAKMEKGQKGKKKPAEIFVSAGSTYDHLYTFHLILFSRINSFDPLTASKSDNTPYCLSDLI